jgi:hypothetical protein
VATLAANITIDAAAFCPAFASYPRVQRKAKGARCIMSKQNGCLLFSVFCRKPRRCALDYQGDRLCHRGFHRDL